MTQIATGPTAHAGPQSSSGAGFVASSGMNGETRPKAPEGGNRRWGRMLRPWQWFNDGHPVVSVLELRGVIGASTGFGRRALSLAGLEKSIERAFKPDDLAAVALAINSPGGSPVQSHLIMRAIRRSAAQKGVPVFAFIEDVGASGGYMLALGADEIYADAASIVGSIGVVSAGFGFHEAMLRLGVERRVYTAGENKTLLDAFKPESQSDVARLDAILSDTHDHFIAMVRERRGNALKEDGEIFSGAFWTAAGARQRGLIDGTAHLVDFLQARYGDDVKLNRVMETPSLTQRLFGGRAASWPGPVTAPVGERPSGELATFAETLEARSLWARFGL